MELHPSSAGRGVQSQLGQLLEKHRDVFRDELGLLKGFEAQIHVDPSAQPVYCRARSVPYSMRVKVEEELDRLVRDGVLEPVQFSSFLGSSHCASVESRQVIRQDMR